MRFDQLAELTGGTLGQALASERVFTGVSIDSRSIRNGQLFIALRGAQTDGHNYINDALSRGAAGIMVDKKYGSLDEWQTKVPTVAVDDCHKAMLTMAGTYRESLKARFVAITGSNGKTTTKEFTWQMLSAITDKAYRSPGNFNNLFGAPLSLMAIPQATEVAVMELGISTENEMPQLSRLIHPDVIALTNVGPSHLEFLNSVGDVAEAKLELVRQADKDKKVIVNADDQLLMDHLTRYRSDAITIGLSDKANYTAESIESGDNGETVVIINGHKFILTLSGQHHVYNLLMAFAICRELGYSFENIATEKINFDSAPMRGQTIKVKNIQFIVDCYNANPDSMRSALATFFERNATGRKVLILGDMLELGQNSENYHRRLGRMITDNDFDCLALVGGKSKVIFEEVLAGGIPKEKVIHFASADLAAAWAQNFLRADDLVLLKASRGVGLETVLNVFTGEDGN